MAVEQRPRINEATVVLRRKGSGYGLWLTDTKHPPSTRQLKRRKVTGGDNMKKIFRIEIDGKDIPESEMFKALERGFGVKIKYEKIKS